mgnify:CR=1 FL=1
MLESNLDRMRAKAVAEGVLMEAGLASGREVLVIDQTRCTSCGNCIDACGRRHGYSRLQLRGIQVDTYMFPTACRHCSDPACLMCSVNGIVRLPSGEIKIVPDNCIGCGSCAERCPYGNISMHPVEQEKPGFFPSLTGAVAIAQSLAAASKDSETRLAGLCERTVRMADGRIETAARELSPV